MSNQPRKPPYGVPGADTLNAQWMTELVRHLGYDATVTDFEMRPVGTGRMADSLRISLRYAGASNGAPPSMVGKFPSAEESVRVNSALWGAYQREVLFYKHFADRAVLRTPRCYYAEISPSKQDFILLLEDLAPAQQGDQLTGLTLEQARLAVEEAAKLHASHWDNGELDELPWIDGTRNAPEMFPEPFVREMWTAFCERYADGIDEECIKVGNALIEHYDVWRNGYRGPRCLIHTDFRADNLLFSTAEGGYPVAVVDWQSLAYRCCMSDIAYLLGGSLATETRRLHEDELLRHYHEHLTLHGVRNYDFSQARSDYARYSFSLFLVSFVVASGVKRTERGDRMFLSMVRSSASHVLDLDAIQLLRQTR